MAAGVFVLALGDFSTAPILEKSRIRDIAWFLVALALLDRRYIRGSDRPCIFAITCLWGLASFPGGFASSDSTRLATFIASAIMGLLLPGENGMLKALRTITWAKAVPSRQIWVVAVVWALLLNVDVIFSRSIRYELWRLRQIDQWATEERLPNGVVVHEFEKSARDEPRDERKKILSAFANLYKEGDTERVTVIRTGLEEAPIEASNGQRGTYYVNGMHADFSNADQFEGVLVLELERDSFLQRLARSAAGIINRIRVIRLIA